MPDINEEYERYLRKHLSKLTDKILHLYWRAIDHVYIGIDRVTFNGKVFKVSDYPQLKRRIEKVLADLNSNVYTAIVNGIDGAWDLSNKKNNIIVDRRLGKRQAKPLVKRILYDPNKEALSKFVNRKDKGLGLSDRVWKLVEPFKYELEAGLGAGIADGKPAAVMARDAKKYLKEPDRLFRRVRNSDGKLVLSNPAKAYHPGQGVYRSSFKNSNRLTRTENNMAYRTADHERWKNQPFVLGIEVRLSNSHPRYDICDTLKGKYPKDFLFKGWHPHCLCHAIPVMMSDEDYDKLEDSILGIADFDPESVAHVEQPPAGFSKYVKDNEKRIAGWKSKPYWVKDNQSVYDEAIK